MGPDYHKQVLWLIGGLLLLRIGFLFLSPFNLHGDEAQYWAWSKSLDWGYYTKPPGIAAVIAFFTSIFGDAEWAVRIGSPILHSVTGYLIYRTARKLYSGATGFWAACFYLLMPALFLSSSIISTDVPLLLCWALALNAWAHLRESASWRHAIQLGMALGLGVLSKYAMLFFIPGIILIIICDPPTRKALLSLKGVVICLIFMAWLTPNILWNINHDFATLTHTAANADFEAGQPLINFVPLLEFLLGQFVVFGPVTLILGFFALWAAYKHRLDDPSRLIAIFAVIPLIVISIQALLSQADLNWAVTGLVALSIITAHYCVKYWPRLRKWCAYGVMGQSLLCLTAMMFYAAPDLVNAAGRANEVKRLRGWPATVQAVSDAYQKGHDGHKFRAVAMDKRLHFYALNYYGIRETAPHYMWLYRSHPDNNHAEISDPLPAGAAPVLIVNYHNKPEYHAALREDFKRLEELPPIDIDLGGGIRRKLRLWAGYGYEPTQSR